MAKPWWNSLRVKIIAWSLVPTVIILSAVAWFTFYSYQRVLGDLAIRQYPEIVQPKARAFLDAMNGLVSTPLLSIIMQIDTNHDLPIQARAQNILQNARGLEVFDAGIIFLDRQGKIFRTEPPQPELVGQDWSSFPTFRAINQAPNFSATTDLMTLGSSGKKVFCVAVAMSGQTWNEVVGASYYCFTVYPATPNIYYQTISKLNLGPNLFVVDRNHQVVF